MGVNVMGLFDGMSCGQIAAGRANIEIDNYYASEVNQYATKITNANYPNTIQLGDVTRWREWSVDWSSIDILMGGSPCQGFSLAGKQLAFDDPRSALFFEYLNILNHIKSVNPNVKFLLENVKMKKEYMGVITGLLGVEPVFINSALVSAQSRPRHYWTNWDFSPPGDKRVTLNDILILNNGDSFKVHYKKNGGKIKAVQDKASCLTGASGNSCGNHSEMDVIVLNDAKITLTKFNRVDIHVSPLVRRYCPIECERLQTIDDGYTSCVSKSQRFKALANGWTVDVIAHILRSIAA